MSLPIPKYSLQRTNQTELAVYVELIENPDVIFYGGVKGLMQMYLGIVVDDEKEPSSPQGILACEHFMKFNNARSVLSKMKGIGKWAGFIEKWGLLVNMSMKPEKVSTAHWLIKKAKAGELK